MHMEMTRATLTWVCRPSPPLLCRQGGMLAPLRMRVRMLVPVFVPMRGDLLPMRGVRATVVEGDAEDSPRHHAHQSLHDEQEDRNNLDQRSGHSVSDCIG